ncbi:MAG TPA: hypothetical protein VIK12_00800, partial [Pengzhenrongella sp.]
YGDVLTWMPEPDPLSPALEAEGPVVAHRDLDRWAARILSAHGGIHARGRVLVEAAGRTSLLDALGIVLGAYAMNGSVVLCAPGTPATPEARRRLVDSELITDEVPPG